MNVWNCYKMAFKKAFKFKGRASRAEYWWAVLMNFIITYVAGCVVSIINAFAGKSDTLMIGFGLVVWAYNLVIFIPFWSLAVRRLHDTGHRGWWLLVPVVNFIFLVKAGTPGPNKFDAAAQSQNHKKKNARKNGKSGTPEILYCPHCHKEYGKETPYCPGCGGRLIER